MVFILHEYAVIYFSSFAITRYARSGRVECGVVLVANSQMHYGGGEVRKGFEGEGGRRRSGRGGRGERVGYRFHEGGSQREVSNAREMVE